MIPNRRELRRCGVCQRLVLWTVTRAGAWMLVDPRPDERGNQACYRIAPRTWQSRSLDGADALPPAPHEHRFVPHVATCKAPKAARPTTLPPNVVRLDAHRSARRR